MRYACIVLCLLAFSIHAGSGLRCYECSTNSGDRRCGDPFNKSYQNAQDCEYRRPQNQYGYNNQYQVASCLKRKQLVNDQELVTRSCTFERETVCVPTTVHQQVKDVFCQVCNEDGCNSAHSLTPATLTALLSAAFWAMAAKLL